MHVCFSSTNNTCTDENTEKSDIKLASSSSSSSSSTKTMHESVSITVNPAPDLQIPGTQASSRKLAIVFTCTVCNTRSAKQFSESAYQNGVVIVQCPGCQNRHLIADRLGIFQDGEFDIDTIAATTGQSVTKISAGDMEFHLQDLLGYDKMREILQSTGVDIDVDDDADLSNSAGKDPKVS
jgi:protein import protein ZIM17